ncbi:Regulatory protein, P-II family [uncultured delta proteobacterium]|uniref:Regulatory protein, P-II family n=1 Tax=uncultured delta proteobacterium TaxID=34034 RepID=A0A212K110_9DELT|nr:Regulatory protein, P-II family [uncultured delta proteobacterium]
MSLAFMPGKLLISMVGRHKGEKFVSIAKAAGARGGTILFGRAVVDNKILQALFLADVQQDIVFTLMRDEADAVISAVCATCREQPKKLGGIAFVLDVSGMLVRQNQNAPKTTEPAKGARSEKMESGYTLLTVIVNNGYADDVMAQARKAGARGGTILTGRGTASEEDVQFFGITLVPEKEVLMIVTEKELVTPILDAIRTVPTLAEPGGGIVYSMNVEEFILLGQ